jgi:hypothetical protein
VVVRVGDLHPATSTHFYSCSIFNSLVTRATFYSPSQLLTFIDLPVKSLRFRERSLTPAIHRVRVNLADLQQVPEPAKLNSRHNRKNTRIKYAVYFEDVTVIHVNCQCLFVTVAELAEDYAAFSATQMCVSAVQS